MSSTSHCIRSIFLGLGLLACSAAVTASDDTIRSTSVPYKDSAGESLTLHLYGGDGTEFSRTILCSKDGTCTLFGFTNKSFGDTTDFLMVHPDPKSGVATAETYGGTNRDMLYQAIPTPDGGYFTSGETESMFFTALKVFSPHREPRPMYVKLDAAGKLLWAGNVELGSDISGAEIARVVQTPDGGYLLAGQYWEAFSDDGRLPMPDEWSAPAPGKTKGWKYTYPLLVKLGADGKPQWMRHYIFGEKGGAATAIALMPSGDVLVTGAIFIEPFNKLFVMEVDPQGAPVRTQQYESDGHLGANGIIHLQGGDYMIAGHMLPSGAPPEAFTARLAPDGKFASGNLYQDPNGLRSLDLLEAPDGKVCLMGRTENGNANKAEGVAWLLDGHDADLGELWLTGAGNTELESAAPLATGGFEFLGDTDAFGASGYDFITTTWTPSASVATSKRLKVSVFKPKLSDVAVTSTTGKLDVVRVLPVERFGVQAIGPQAPDQ